MDIKEVFLCFDWTEDLIIKPDYLASIKLTYLPCSKADKLIWYSEIPEDCITDEE